MSWMVIFTQVVLPLLLLLWLALAPAPGPLFRGVQLMSVAAALFGLALAALWTMPPYWTPWLYGLAFVVIALYQLKKNTPAGPAFQPMPARSLMALVITAGLGTFGSYLAYQALQGRGLPEGEVVDIAPPFVPGHYLVAHGGATPMVNVHLKTLDTTIDRFRPWRGQSKALDIFRITPLGLNKEGWLPTDPARYASFAVPVVAPCQGEVALVRDGYEDMPVPVMDREHMAGNHVAIDCGDFFVILAHLRQGSILVSKGDFVQLGEPLAQIGNSGNSSEPHLHVHAQRGLPGDAPLSGEPLWLTINQHFPVRNSRLHVVKAQFNQSEQESRP
ncbi:MAG: M23 family metallopeptidase [Pseudomonadota bacterium]